MVFVDGLCYVYTVKKPCRNAPNSDVDNGGAEPNDVGVGIFRPPCRLVRATVVHIGISRSFFYSVVNTIIAFLLLAKSKNENKFCENSQVAHIFSQKLNVRDSIRFSNFLRFTFFRSIVERLL